MVPRHIMTIGYRDVLLVSASLGLASPALAQERGQIAEGGPDSARVGWSDATTRCVPAVATSYVTLVRHSDCTVEGVTALGVANGREWHVVRYLRELIVADSVWADTMPLDEMVLVSRAPDAADAQVTWRWTSDRRFQFLDTLRWIPTPRNVFLGLTVCLNGTGGCGEDYLRFDRGRWVVVAQPFGRDLQARLPPDHRLHKGRRLDLATLAGVWPVAGPGDANCCPRFEIPFRLRLDGDTLRLVDAGPLRPSPDR
jgi:hypothetical protein